jgi:hypothetical protein
VLAVLVKKIVFVMAQLVPVLINVSLHIIQQIMTLMVMMMFKILIVVLVAVALASQLVVVVIIRPVSVLMVQFGTGLLVQLKVLQIGVRPAQLIAVLAPLRL